MSHRTSPKQFRALLQFLSACALVVVLTYAGNLMATSYAASCGGSIRANRSLTGQIVRAGTKCTYSYTGKLNETIAVRMSGISSSLDPSVNIRYRNRSQIRENNSANSSNSSVVAGFTLPSTGTYSIVTTGSRGSTGAFKLAVSNCSLLHPGRSVSASVASGQFACYTISGRSVRQVKMSQLKGKSDRRFQPKLELYDSRGQLSVSSRPSRGRASVSIPSTGDYTVIARSYDDQSSGSFSISGSR